MKLIWVLTINKAQGLTLRRAGVYLPAPVFAHGQLYVAASRVGSFDRLRVHVEESEDQGWEATDAAEPMLFTENVVYQAILNELPGRSSGPKQKGHAATIVPPTQPSLRTVESSPSAFGRSNDRRNIGRPALELHAPRRVPRSSFQPADPGS